MATNASVIDRWFWRLGLLDPAGSLRVDRRVLAVIVSYHLIALLAFFPYFFSLSALAIAFVGWYVFGTLGINLGYHRLLVHRGFACPLWLEHCFVFLGACSFQGPPISWAAIHRIHHQNSDENGDPHSPRSGFFWSHLGWVLVYDPAIRDIATYERYSRDLIHDRFYKKLERPSVWWAIHLGQWSAYPIMGALVGGLAGLGLRGALQLGLSWVVWGVFVRTVFLWHITWSVNSVTHFWGYRNYATQDDSRNNVLVGLITSGEGWHNNHHSNPRSVKNSHRWWELDVTYLTVCMLARVGLAWHLVLPRRRQAPRPVAEPTEQRSAA